MSHTSVLSFRFHCLKNKIKGQLVRQRLIAKRFSASQTSETKWTKIKQRLCSIFMFPLRYLHQMKTNLTSEEFIIPSMKFASNTASSLLPSDAFLQFLPLQSSFCEEATMNGHECTKSIATQVMHI